MRALLPEFQPAQVNSHLLRTFFGDQIWMKSLLKEITPVESVLADHETPQKYWRVYFASISFLLTPDPYLLPEDIPSNAPLHLSSDYSILFPKLRQTPSLPLITEMRPYPSSSRPYLLAQAIQSTYYDQKSPYVSDEDERDPSPVTGWPASSTRRVMPSFAGHGSLSDVMDDLLPLRLSLASNEPSNTNDVSVKVLSWWKDTGKG
ncbi:hypothetical protein B0H16DRAFT_1718508 [Mycena metata]|uniref:Uncharacterized protein n=1 Tax=Mycena metata TaxID=1033252 RepID=A0AAD7NIV5_9AGAR|nr:hypothetical protein B0H16DRAFT_1718508 [Mycena metata]